MSRRGKCSDDAPTERVFEFKNRMDSYRRLYNFEETKQHIIHYLIDYYTRHRPHSKHDGMTPDKAEQVYWNFY